MYKMMLLAAGLMTSTAGFAQAIGPSIAYVKGSVRGDSIYLVDPDGRIAYKSRPGPFGFTPAALEAALRLHRSPTHK